MKILTILGLVLFLSPAQKAPTFILTGEIKDIAGEFLVDAVVIIHAEGPPSSRSQTLPKDVILSPDPKTGKYSTELQVGLYYDVFFSRAGFMPECHVVYLPGSLGRDRELNVTLKIAPHNCDKCWL